MAYLTCQPTTIKVGAKEDCYDLMEAYKKWKATRDISNYPFEPFVADWEKIYE